MPTTIFTSNDIQQRLQPIFTSYNIRQAILFGSYSKGTATKNSDVDLLVDQLARAEVYWFCRNASGSAGR